MSIIVEMADSVEAETSVQAANGHVAAIGRESQTGGHGNLLEMLWEVLEDGLAPHMEYLQLIYLEILKIISIYGGLGKFPND